MSAGGKELGADFAGSGFGFGFAADLGSSNFEPQLLQ